MQAAGSRLNRSAGAAPFSANCSPLGRGGQRHRAGQLCIGLQTILAQGAEDALAAVCQPLCALFLGALRRHIVPHLCPGGKGQAQTAVHPLRQRVQLLRRQRSQCFRGEGGGLAHIPYCRHKGCAKLICQRLPPLAGEEDQVLAAGVDAAHCTGGKRRTGFHQNALLVHQIPAGQSRTALDRKVGEDAQKAGVAALVVLEHHDLARGVQGGVKVLQKQLFRAGVGVDRQVHHCHPVALQKPPRRHDAGGLGQRKVPSRARCTPQQDHIAGGCSLGAQHKGAAHRPHHAVHKGILPEDGLFHLGGKAFKAAQLLRLCVCRALGKQTVCFHIPQHLTAVLQRRLHPGILRFQPGVLLLQHFVQPLLLFQQRRVQVRQAVARRFFGLRLFRLRLCAAELQFAARAEHAVHQAFPIIGVCHGAALHRCFFFQYSELRGILQA